MKEYNISYFSNKYVVVLLTLFWIIPLTLLTSLIVSNDHLMKLADENKIVAVILFIAIMTGLLLLVLLWGMKLFKKNITFVVSDEYINIDNGIRQIYLNNIINVKFETLYYKGMPQKDVITGYQLIIIHNKKEKLMMVVFTGTSAKEQRNVEQFLEFYADFNAKYQKKGG